jgi:short subunit dehydrogenase-like uncharacterized protein
VPARSPAKSYDLVLFGATGFTGGLTAEYLAAHAPAGLRWALAGRNPDKLEGVRRRLVAIDPVWAELPLLQADSSDAAALRAIAESTRVVISTVGPYVHYGEPLVAACAAAGTDYVDITGEPEFVDRMWLKYHETAKQSGARIVHCCGFDSIPHDLGVYFTVQQLPADAPIRINGYLKADAEFSGGTFHSAINAFARIREYANVARQRRRLDGWPLDRRIGSTGSMIHRHKGLDSWVVPLPTIDPQIVRRSAAMLERYGPDFRYGHFLQVGSAKAVAKLLGGVSAMAVAAQIKPAREWLLRKKQPGQGPSAERRERSSFRVRFYAVAGNKRVVTEVSGGDPGYGETAKMLGESALCLAFDELPKRSGQLTTAAAMGDALIPRLQRAGIRFEVVES